MSFEGKNILLTGSSGFLGPRILTELQARGVSPKQIKLPRSHDSDLRDARVCADIVKGVDIVIHAAAHVGGIEYNKTHPGTLLYDNTAMTLNLMEAARRAGVSKFVGVGSVCEYPAFAPVPFVESDVWNGFPEPSNGAYGIAKRMMLAQGQAYRDEFGFNAIHLLMINLYGPGDHFTSERSHVIAALIHKFVTAKEQKQDSVTVWGTGKATREFLYVDDAADAVLRATELYNDREPMNIGSGHEISIRDLADMLKEIIGYSGELLWDTSKPDGQLRRQLDVSLAKEKIDFTAHTSLREGLELTVADFLKRRVAS